MKFRKNLRLKDYDYSANGYYFVTICCSCRVELCIEYRDVIERHLKKLENYNGVRLDYYKLMPNHLHFILILGAEPKSSFLGKAAALPLHRHIQNFKSKTTLEIKKNGFVGKRFWQPNYYEHVIRSEESLIKIREYIENNPTAETLNWNELDRH